MVKISKANIQTYRAKTFRTNPGQQIFCMADAIEFVKERGFVFFWPIKGINLPSLWTAVAGNRPVANAHDDPGHVTWSWKDGSIGKNIWYYGKILRKKATIIDLSIAPYFYALSNNYGDPAEDIHFQYFEGHITQEVKLIFDAILDNGPMDTVAIRRYTHLTSKESNSRFDRAIALLQSDFKILPVGISDSGGWHYAFIYDLVHRYYPEITETARQIKENKARSTLLELYFRAVGAAQLRDVSRLFQWGKKDSNVSLERLLDNGTIIKAFIELETDGEWFVLRELI
jgi:hypothetical protein